MAAALLPDNAIVCDESITQGREFGIYSVHSAPHDWLQLTGGAIGIGLPLATGAAVACPDRKVVLLQADGSGMYTVQALWTQARERLDCLTIIYANRTYATLHGEMKNVGVIQPGENAKRMLDLVDPTSTGCRSRRAWAWRPCGSIRSKASPRRCARRWPARALPDRSRDLIHASRPARRARCRRATRGRRVWSILLHWRGSAATGCPLPFSKDVP